MVFRIWFLQKVAWVLHEPLTNQVPYTVVATRRASTIALRKFVEKQIRLTILPNIQIIFAVSGLSSSFPTKISSIYHLSS